MFRLAIQHLIVHACMVMMYAYTHIDQQLPHAYHCITSINISNTEYYYSLPDYTYCDQKVCVSPDPNIRNQSTICVKNGRICPDPLTNVKHCNFITRFIRRSKLNHPSFARFFKENPKSSHTLYICASIISGHGNDMIRSSFALDQYLPYKHDKDTGSLIPLNNADGMCQIYWNYRWQPFPYGKYEVGRKTHLGMDNIGACCDLCWAAYALGCRGFTWSIDDKGSCFLYSKLEWANKQYSIEAVGLLYHEYANDIIKQNAELRKIDDLSWRLQDDLKNEVIFPMYIEEGPKSEGQNVKLGMTYILSGSYSTHAILRQTELDGQYICDKDRVSCTITNPRRTVLLELVNPANCFDGWKVPVQEVDPGGLAIVHCKQELHSGNMFVVEFAVMNNVQKMNALYDNHKLKFCYMTYSMDDNNPTDMGDNTCVCALDRYWCGPVRTKSTIYSQFPCDNRSSWEEKTILFPKTTTTPHKRFEFTTPSEEYPVAHRTDKPGNEGFTNIKLIAALSVTFIVMLIVIAIMFYLTTYRSTDIHKGKKEAASAKKESDISAASASVLHTNPDHEEGLSEHPEVDKSEEELTEETPQEVSGGDEESSQTGSPRSSVRSSRGSSKNNIIIGPVSEAEDK